MGVNRMAASLNRSLRAAALVAIHLVVWIAAAPAGAQVTVDDFSPGVFTDSRGTTLHYRLFTPTGYDPAGSTRYPLVTFLAGNGSQGSDNRKQVREGALVWAQPGNQARHPAFVLSPQAPANDGWGRPEGYAGYPEASPLAALFELMDEIERRYPIDPDRRYITGMSGGGWGTLRALSQQPGRFAASILVCPAGDSREHAGIPPHENGLGVVTGLERLPLWFFHGTVDPVVSIELTRQRVAALRKAGGDPRLTEYPGVKHDAWVKAYAEPEIVDWLYSHRRGPGAGAANGSGDEHHRR